MIKRSFLFYATKKLLQKKLIFDEIFNFLSVRHVLGMLIITIRYNSCFKRCIFFLVALDAINMTDGLTDKKIFEFEINAKWLHHLTVTDIQTLNLSIAKSLTQIVNPHMVPLVILTDTLFDLILYLTSSPDLHCILQLCPLGYSDHVVVSINNSLRSSMQENPINKAFFHYQCTNWNSFCDYHYNRHGIKFLIYPLKIAPLRSLFLSES